MNTISNRKSIMSIFFITAILCYLYILSFYSIIIVGFDPFDVILTDFGNAILDSEVFLYLNFLVSILSFIFLLKSRGISTKWYTFMKIVTHIILWTSLLMLVWSMLIFGLASGLHG